MFKYNQTRIYHRTVSAAPCENGFDEVSTIVAFQQGDKLDPENDILFWAKSAPSEDDAPSGTRTIWAGICLFAIPMDPAEFQKSVSSSFYGATVDFLGHSFVTRILEPSLFGVSSIDGLLDVLAEVSAIRQIANSSREIVRTVNERTGFSRKQKWLCWLDNAIDALMSTCNKLIHQPDGAVSLTASQPFAPDGTGDFVNPSLGRLECSRERLITGLAHRELMLMRVPLKFFQSGEQSFSGESVVVVKANKENNDSGSAEEADRLSRLLAQKGLVLDNIEWVAPFVVQATDGYFWCISNSFSSGTAGKKELEVLAVSVSEDVAEKYWMLEQAMYQVLETAIENYMKYYKVLNDHGEEVWIKAENATPMAYA